MTAALQHTLDEAIERGKHIERLERSMARWRASELDRVLPDEYARYMTTLDCLKAGEPYRIIHLDPTEAMQMSPEERRAHPIASMFVEIAEGLAQTSRTYRDGSTWESRNATKGKK